MAVEIQEPADEPLEIEDEREPPPTIEVSVADTRIEIERSESPTIVIEIPPHRFI